jgi:hypothetical protein
MSDDFDTSKGLDELIKVSGMLAGNNEKETRAALAAVFWDMVETLGFKLF